MMKKLFLCLLCLSFLVACKAEKVEEKEDVDNDFWQAVIEAVEDDLTDDRYYDDKWEINVENLANAKDPAHRSITIRQVYETETQKTTVIFSLQNQDQQTLSYIYKIEKNQDTLQLELESSDEKYQKYQMTYLENAKEKAKGELVVENQQVTGDNTPLFKEAVEAWNVLLDDYQKEFGLDYSKYDFTNLPKLAKNSNIGTTINDDNATTINYYSDVYANARGYSLQAFLEVQKDLSSVQFGIYNQDRETNDESATLTLEKRAANLYNMIPQKDAEVYYAVYFKDDRAYIYHQDKSDSEIVNDQDGEQAIYILSKK